jgi:hypothetical protein
MCNDFGNNLPYSAYRVAFSQIRAPVVFPKAAPNLGARDDIWPTEPAPVFRRRDEGVELVQLRWSFPPARPKGAPVINFRSEERRFPKGSMPDPGRTFLRVHGDQALPGVPGMTRTSVGARPRSLDRGDRRFSVPDAFRGSPAHTGDCGGRSDRRCLIAVCDGSTHRDRIVLETYRDARAAGATNHSSRRFQRLGGNVV